MQRSPLTAPRREAGFYRANARWLGAGALLALASSFGQTFFLSVFAGEIRAEFDLGHGAWGGLYGTATLCAAAAMVASGGIADRLSVRQLGAMIFAGLGLACLAMASVSSALMLVPVVFALRFLGQGMCSHLAQTAMARWFVATRGRALAFATLGFAVGEAVLPVVLVAALEVVSWRTLWLVSAVAALAAIPVLALLLRRGRVPLGTGAADQAAGLGGRHWTRLQVLRHPLFWCTGALVMGPSAFVTALFFQQVPLAAVKGWRHLELVALFPVYTFASVLSMLVAGQLIDRVGTRALMPLAPLPLAAGFVVLGHASSLWAGAVGLLLTGLTQGAMATLPTAFWAEHFGTRHLGAIRSMALAVMVLGTAAGPVLTGVGIDLGWSIDRQLPWIALYFLATAAVMRAGLARSGVPPRVPAGS